MRAVSIANALGALALLVLTPTALAEGNGVVQRTDPQASSPAGVIYQIPLDTGRRDAAPVLPVGRRNGGNGGTGGGASTGGAGGIGGSSNGAAGGGSGTAGAAAGRTGSGATGAAASSGGGTPEDPSSIHSENGFGSSAQVPGVSPAAALTGAGVPSSHTAGSTLPSYLLMVLVGLAAVGVGLIAGRSGGRGRARSDGV